MQERATQLQGQEARQRAETQRGDQQAWDADAERPRRSCGGQPHVPDVRSEDRGDVRPQAPARFRGARLSESTSSDKAVWMRAAYQRRFPFGWHELWWQARDAARGWGAVSGRGVHRQLPARFVCWIGLCAQAGQHRVRAPLFALARRHQGGLPLRSARLRRDRSHGQPQSLASAGASGPALHLLLADQFQVDVYPALGWKTDGSPDFASSLVLRQVF